MSEEMNLEEAEEMASEQDLGQDAELDDCVEGGISDEELDRIADTAIALPFKCFIFSFPLVVFIYSQVLATDCPGWISAHLKTRPNAAFSL